MLCFQSVTKAVRGIRPCLVQFWGLGRSLGQFNFLAALPLGPWEEARPTVSVEPHTRPGQPPGACLRKWEEGRCAADWGAGRGWAPGPSAAGALRHQRLHLRPEPGAGVCALRSWPLDCTSHVQTLKTTLRMLFFLNLWFSRETVPGFLPLGGLLAETLKGHSCARSDPRGRGRGLVGSWQFLVVMPGRASGPVSPDRHWRPGEAAGPSPSPSVGETAGWNPLQLVSAAGRCCPPGAAHHGVRWDGAALSLRRAAAAPAPPRVPRGGRPGGQEHAAPPPSPVSAHVNSSGSRRVSQATG